MYVPRSQNQFADALATLASLVQIPEGTFVQPIEIKRREVLAHEREICMLDDEINDGKPWYNVKIPTIRHAYLSRVHTHQISSYTIVIAL